MSINPQSLNIIALKIYHNWCSTKTGAHHGALLVFNLSAGYSAHFLAHLRDNLTGREFTLFFRQEPYIQLPGFATSRGKAYHGTTTAGAGKNHIYLRPFADCGLDSFYSFLSLGKLCTMGQGH